MSSAFSSLAHALIHEQIISHTTAENNLTQEESVSLLYYLIYQVGIPAEKIAKACAAYFKLPYINLYETNANTFCFNAISNETLREYQFLPLNVEQHTLSIAIADPDVLTQLDALAPLIRYTIKPVIVDYVAFCEVLNKYLANQCYAHMQVITTKEANIAEFVQQLILDATIRKASDIHIEPQAKQLRIRFRIDGLLHEATTLNKILAAHIISHIKILANIDIAEKRLPQDGRFTFHSLHGRKRDCRISTCPTLFGEKCVIRLLDPKQQLLDLNELGLEKKAQELFVNAIRKPQGLILVTGPTGSGKTLTLYTALKKLNDQTKNISTVEDPIEIQLPGINQVNVLPKAGLTFNSTLRAFLRQDPDIIMVGEIRDKETAHMAISAAQTGHLVFSTLHTNNAIEAMTRLINMDIEPFNIINSVSLIIAQRLIRKLCARCRTKCILPKEIQILTGLREQANTTIYQANQCQYCHQGYLGRTGIYEVIAMTTTLKNLLFKTQDTETLIQHAKKEGMQTLWQAALNKVAAGVTSLEEAYRVASQ